MQMVLTVVEGKENIDIVNRCNNKRSTDFDGIDTVLIKKVIQSFVNENSGLILKFSLD